MAAEDERTRAFARHERRQRLDRLGLSYRQRLEWLEEAKRFAVRATRSAAERRARGAKRQD